MNQRPALDALITALARAAYERMREQQRQAAAQAPPAPAVPQQRPAA